MKRNVFSSRWKMMTGGRAWTADGRLFRAQGAATGKAQSLSVDRQMGETIRGVVADNWR